MKNVIKFKNLNSTLYNYCNMQLVYWTRDEKDETMGLYVLMADADDTDTVVLKLKMDYDYFIRDGRVCFYKDNAAYILKRCLNFAEEQK